MCCCDEDLCCVFEETNPNSVKEPRVPKQVSSPNDNENEPCLIGEDSIKSSLISVTPSNLRYPYNDRNNHVKRVTIWNLTLNSMKVRFKPSHPDLFSVDFGSNLGFQLILYGLAAKTVTVTCTPGYHKIVKGSLQLHVYTSRDTCECVHLPLEIYPSSAWFQLPRSIQMPSVAVGQTATVVINLPQPKQYERFFVTFHPSFTANLLTLLPMNGTIGGEGEEGGIKEITCIYHPTEYTTVACTIKIYFPGLSDAPHEIQVFARCRPGHEIDIIRKEIAEIETFRPKTAKTKKQFPKMKFKGSRARHRTMEQREQRLDKAYKKCLNLFSNGGVMHFMLQKDDPAEPVELGADDETDAGIENSQNGGPPVIRLQTIDDTDREEFDDEEESQALRKSTAFRNRRSTQRKSRSRSREPSLYSPSNKKKVSTGGSQKNELRPPKEKRDISNSVISKDAPKDFTALQKFVQMALVVITRWRADQRLAKLKVLMSELKPKRKSSFKGSVKSKSSTGGKKKISIVGTTTRSSARKSLHILFDNDPENNNVNVKEPGGTTVETGDKKRKSSQKVKHVEGEGQEGRNNDVNVKEPGGTTVETGDKKRKSNQKVKHVEEEGQEGRNSQVLDDEGPNPNYHREKSLHQHDPAEKEHRATKKSLRILGSRKSDLDDQQLGSQTEGVTIADKGQPPAEDSAENLNKRKKSKFKWKKRRD